MDHVKLFEQARSLAHKEWVFSYLDFIVLLDACEEEEVDTDKNDAEKEMRN